MGAFTKSSGEMSQNFGNVHIERAWNKKFTYNNATSMFLCRQNHQASIRCFGNIFLSFFFFSPMNYLGGSISELVSSTPTLTPFSLNREPGRALPFSTRVGGYLIKG